MQTLSLGNWMQLPDLPFKEWLQDYRQYVFPHINVQENTLAAF